ncbi:sensor histidine kinase [Nonomuraea sp. NPDC046570]|uniref:sensor histidine kinase n=1 Tax=Nonomuraea sp. NPDC046570 TaxID=3155255 RepID=UPI0033BFCFF3
MRKVSASTLVTLAVVAVVILGSVITGLARPDRTPNLWDFALPLLAAVALLFRQRHPVAVLLTVTVVVGAYYPFAHLDGPLIVAPILALYTAADHGHLVAAISTACASLLAMGLGEIGTVRHIDNSLFITLVGWMAAMIAAGGVTRNRRAYLHEAEQRVLEAEHTKEEEAKRRETEERLRIARELHDVLGHNISMINVQAGAALHGIRKRPEDAEAALKAIKETSRETLRELRTTLGVLRQVDEDAPTAPAAGLARLDELVRTSGLSVTTRVEGERAELPTEVDLAAVRIIREALTNVARHSGADEATLTVAHAPGKILIEVADRGPGAAYTEGNGYGVRGMRERATALGGTLEAGPRPEGGFRVAAELPLNGAR